MVESVPSVLRAQLEAEQARVREQLAHLGHDDSGGDLDYDDGFADTSQVTAERGEVDALVASLQETLADVEDALAKFDTGAYGACESCGKSIAEARLEAMPAARLCIDCASHRR